MPDLPELHEQEKLRRFASLKDLPVWDELIDYYRDEREKRAQKVGMRLLKGGPVDQREMDRERGFWLGITAVLGAPESAQSQLPREPEEGEE